MKEAFLRLRGSHAWLVGVTDGFPLAPPHLIHEMYFAKRALHRVRH